MHGDHDAFAALICLATNRLDATHNQLVSARIRSIRAADRACMAGVTWAEVS